MIITSQTFKDFLKRDDVQADFEDKSIDSLYKKLEGMNEYHGTETGILTRLLKELDINPLDYLDYIPRNYLILVDEKELNIPKTIMNIRSYALYGSDLTKIFYEGTEEEWLSIHKEFNWNPNHIKVKCKG